MKRAIWVFAATLLLGPAAMAGVDNLAGGALITHYVSGIPFSTDAPACGDWCCAYAGFEISDPADEVLRINSGTAAVWYVLAAWSEPKIWKGVEFGFGNYVNDPAMFAFVAFGPCFPVDGLELPTAGWPGPNEGMAITVSGADVWSGNWLPVYSFTGYAYDAVGQIPIDVDPATGVIAFVNQQNPPQTYPVDPNADPDFYRGAMGINTEGIRAAPSTVPVAVCCIGTSCVVQTEAGCADLGGEWYPGWGEICDPNPCDPVRVCCFGTTTLSCGLLTESLCLSRPGPGVWHEEWESCDPDPCKTAACCNGEVCTLHTELECVNISGTWLETIEDCDPNPCLTYVCCVPGQACQNLPEVDCLAITGATWHEGYKCNDTGVDCDALGACCFETPPYCVMMWEDECHDAHPEITGEFVPGQIWHPDGNCNEGNPWCAPSPVEETSWGRIKQLYQ